MVQISYSDGEYMELNESVKLNVILGTFPICRFYASWQKTYTDIRYTVYQGISTSLTTAHWMIFVLCTSLCELRHLLCVRKSQVISTF